MSFERAICVQKEFVFHSFRGKGDMMFEGIAGKVTFIYINWCHGHFWWLWSYLPNGYLKRVPGNLPNTRDLRKITTALSSFSYVSLSNCGPSQKNPKNSSQKNLSCSVVKCENQSICNHVPQSVLFSVILSAVGKLQTINENDVRTKTHMIVHWLNYGLHKST